MKLGYKVQLSSVTLDITINIKEEIQGHMTLKHKRNFYQKMTLKPSEEIKEKSHPQT